MPGYIGAGGVARKVKAVYVGVGGVARKVQAVYAGVNGVARKVWGGEEPFAYTYTGEHTESEITWEGQAYRLITLTPARARLRLPPAARRRTSGCAGEEEEGAVEKTHRR